MPQSCVQAAELHFIAWQLGLKDAEYASSALPTSLEALFHKAQSLMLLERYEEAKEVRPIRILDNSELSCAS